MKIKVVLPLALFGFIFSGCATPEFNALKILHKDSFYEKALTQTSSAQIISSMQTKAKLSATYLNPIELGELCQKGSDCFFVGIFIEDDFYDKNISGLSNPDYKLQLGANLPVFVAEVDKEKSEIYKKMPMIDGWSSYYIVGFDAKEEPLRLTLTSKSYGKAAISFSKKR